MIRGTADGMVAGTAVGMIPGFTARPAIGATVRPSVSAGVGVVSMTATGARLGVGVRVIGDPVIGVVATGDIITIIIILAVAGIPVAVDTGEATIGGVVIHIRTGATAEHVVRQLHGVLTELVE